VREYIERTQADAALYNGFNLIAGDSRELLYYSNREGHARALEPGVYGLSNHLLDTAWPKVTATKSAFGALLNGEASELIDSLFALLSDRNQTTDDQLPRTGIGRDWERLLSSAFIASSHYGTRSSTVFLVGRDGGLVFVERTFGPGGVPAEQGHFTFQLERPHQTMPRGRH
jgi:uncharacterized protein with NRDE domain